MQEQKQQAKQEPPSQKKQLLPWQERAGFTPTEFAHLFGRQSVWTYRQIYAGRLKIIKAFGRVLIPKTELDRIIAEAAQ